MSLIPPLLGEIEFFSFSPWLNFELHIFVHFNNVITFPDIPPQSQKGWKFLFLTFTTYSFPSLLDVAGLGPFVDAWSRKFQQAGNACKNEK